MTGARQLIEQGRQERLQRGRDEGRVEGRFDGLLVAERLNDLFG